VPRETKSPSKSGKPKKKSRAHRLIEHHAPPRAFDAVRQIAHTLEGVDDATSYGTAALKVHDALFIRLREDNDTLVLRCPIEDRDALIESDPDTYFLTDHYLNYPWVLARLSTINPAFLRDIVAMAHHHALAGLRSTRAKSRPKKARS
jgi:hypothetical protein